MSYLPEYRRHTGLGFEETFSDALPTSTFMIGPVDVGAWDWHEWALAGVAAFFVIRALAGGVSRGVVAPIRKRRRKAARRRKARESYESELKLIG